MFATISKKETYGLHSYARASAGGAGVHLYLYYIDNAWDRAVHIFHLFLNECGCLGEQWSSTDSVRVYVWCSVLFD
jgi:hypothetical protein